MISSTTLYGDLPLHLACEEGHSLSDVQFLYNAYPEAICTKNHRGLTPLAVALAPNNYHLYYGDDEQDAVTSFFQEQLEFLVLAEAGQDWLPSHSSRFLTKKSL